jgi:4-amino-4-deoxy-L-arabinose transferase-like glycosyltransferase
MAAAVEGRLGGAAHLRLGHRLRRGFWLTGPIALFTLLRIPSFLEPHWYTDEAGYVTTARSLLQGKVLYTQVWNNKPPIHLWTVAVVIQLFGTSEAALHTITFATGVLTLLAVAYLGNHLLSRRRTLVALFVVAVLLGTPLFDAELLVPESLLIAPITWAGAILLTRVGAPDRRRWPLWPVAVGVLAGLAVGYQQTALSETCAFGLILAIVGRVTWRRVTVYATTVLAVTAAWLIPAIVTAGAGKVAYALVGYWIPFTQYRYTGGGAGHVLLHLILPAGVLALLVVGAWLCRRDREPGWGLWVWAGAALLVPAVARQPWAHYLIPSLVPTVLALSSLPLRSPMGAALPRRLAGGALVVGTLLAAAGASAAGMDWVDIINQNPHNVFNYYGGAASVLTRGQSLEAYQDQFDYRVPEDSAVSAWISAHGLDGSSAVVWSADAWLYDDNQLQLILPTPPIYNDESLLGNYGPVARRVAELDPEVVVTEGEARQSYPEINSVLTAGYREVDQSGTEIVWVQDGMVAAVTASPAAG